MNDVIDEAQEAGDLAPDAADRLEDAMGDLVSAAQRGRDSVEHLKTALAHLRNVLGKPDVETALSEIQTAVSELTTALSDIADCFAQMRQILRGGEERAPGNAGVGCTSGKAGGISDRLRGSAGLPAGSQRRTCPGGPDRRGTIRTPWHACKPPPKIFWLPVSRLGAAGAELAKALADAGPGREPDLTRRL